MGHMLEDLVGHLAYHASVGFAECRDMDPPPVPAPAPKEGEEAWEFAVQHEGRTFVVAVREQA